MNTSDEALVQIYALHITDTQRRLREVERHLSFSRLPSVTTDLRRNVADVYGALCEGGCDGLLTLFNKLLRDMRIVSYSECGDFLEGLEFVQLVVATALWKYHVPVGETLEKFVREFDRLDVPSERRRLYEFAQSSGMPPTQAEA